MVMTHDELITYIDDSTDGLKHEDLFEMFSDVFAIDRTFDAKAISNCSHAWDNHLSCASELSRIKHSELISPVDWPSCSFCTWRFTY